MGNFSTSVACRLVCMSLALAAVEPGLATGQSPIILNDVTDASGIGFEHTDGSTGQRYLLEAMSAGLALIDFDLDGILDIYFLNGAPIERTDSGDLPGNALYRHDGRWAFVDVTEAAGVGDNLFGLGVACADYDNDGFPDIYVNNYGRNVLYRNNGDGTFTDATEQAGVANGWLVGSGASFVDVDADGNLDLYVGNYIKFSPENHQVHIHKGLPAYPSPLSFEPQPDTLFISQGDGTFVDASAASGIQQHAGRSMGLVTFDFDNDGDIDILVANDTQNNHLFVNDGTGNFEEWALLHGLAFDYRGKAQASMGVEAADLDGDGLLDVFMTSFSDEFSTYYRNLGDGFFEDLTLRAGGSHASYPHVTWGVAAADFNNDGWPDVFMATGDLDDLRDQRGGRSTTTGYRIPNIVLLNQEGTKLRDLGQTWGSAALVEQSSRGLVVGDLDNDGLIDAVTNNIRARPSVMRNQSISTGGFLKIRLVGVQSNRDGLGARLIIEQAGFRQTIQSRSGHSYQSDSWQWLHVGLPSADEPVRLEVSWLGGTVQEPVECFPGETLLIIETAN